MSKRNVALPPCQMVMGLTPSETTDVRIVIELCDSVGTKRARLVKKILQSRRLHNDYLKLPEVVVTDDRNTWYDYVISECLSKHKTLFTPKRSPYMAAIDKYDAAQQYAARSENRLHAYRLGMIHPERALVSAVINKARKYITRKLGDITIADVVECGRFGPGASTSCSGSDVVPSEKYNTELHSTTNLLQCLALSATPTWLDNWVMAAGISSCDHSKFMAVPKKSTAHRIMAVEPSLNGFIQLGIDYLIRMRYGNPVRFNDQSHNQTWASVASVHDILGTVDFTDSSELIVREAVKLFFPCSWFSVMDDTRTPVTRIKRLESSDETELHKLKNFVSQGNGYCWSMQYIIYDAVANAIHELLNVPQHEAVVSVFGDDVVMSNRADVVELFLDVATFLGWRVNPSKTHWHGNFKESCGTDWYNGVNIRPFFLRGLDPQDGECEQTIYAVNTANQIRFCARNFGDTGCDSAFKSAYDTAVEAIPSEFINTGVPYGYEHGLVKNFDEACPDTEQRNASGMINAICYTTGPCERSVVNEVGLLQAWLHKPPRYEDPLEVYGYIDLIDKQFPSNISYSITDQTVRTTGKVSVSLVNSPIITPWRWFCGPNRPANRTVMKYLSRLPHDRINTDALKPRMFVDRRVESRRGALAYITTNNLAVYQWRDIGPWI